MPPAAVAPTRLAVPVVLLLLCVVCGTTVAPMAIPLVPLGLRYGVSTTARYNGTGDTFNWLLLLDTQASGVVAVANLTVGGAHSDTPPTVVIDGAETRFSPAISTVIETAFVHADGNCSNPTTTPVLVSPQWDTSLVSPEFQATLGAANGVIGVTGSDASGPVESAVGVLACGLDTSSSSLSASPAPLSPLVFTLDLSAPQSSSVVSGYVYVGGVPAAIASEVVWSEHMVASRNASWTFAVFRPSLCGVALLANVSTNWIAVVDTASACLSLPAEAFDAVVAWLPLHCDAVGDPEYRHALPLPCSLRTGTDPAALPQLQFRLSEAGTPLYIRLSDLVLADGRVCLTRGRSMTFSKSVITPSLTAIGLGTLPLRSLYTVLDGERSRVGFVTKNGTSTDDDGASARTVTSACAAPAVCIGGQTYFAAMNVCLPPRCELYYFQRLDDVSQLCTYVRLEQNCGACVPYIQRQRQPRAVPHITSNALALTLACCRATPTHLCSFALNHVST